MFSRKKPTTKSPGSSKPECKHAVADNVKQKTFRGIDDLVASPWIGLYFRHEFALHHSHELLEQPEAALRPAA
ncbi:hypothetical protein J2Y41_004274 [Arthrobacter sp. 1088]|uniref:hypothetical protein n=1 Tax=Arthrobacter sp. 1088 TaxID=2817768 RepID=UPI00285684EC|nr:hypothetical protein [Arthrobacter sp. 1088]MDR6688679.1 hypothetical protein [Arthrobacter sp. 1088]